MFRFAVAVLAVIGLVSLIGSASAAAVGIGWLLLAPIVLVFKIMFFFMLFGAIAHLVGHRGGRSPVRTWNRRWDRQAGRSWNRPGPWARRPGRPWTDDGEAGSRDLDEDLRPADADRFEEWHRMQHARKEVDSWVETPDELDNRENH